MSSQPFAESEYETLRATIRERGTMRIYLVLGGLVAWAALAVALRLAGPPGAVILVPLLVLAITFELNFFVHTGVERIGRYLQVFYEENSGSIGWETTAMNYGAKFASGPDPLFVNMFATAAAINFVSSFSRANSAWSAISLVLHFVLAYRIVSARRTAASQRALDLDRFRSLLSK
jgi:hypothetical protein